MENRTLIAVPSREFSHRPRAAANFDAIGFQPVFAGRFKFSFESFAAVKRGDFAGYFAHSRFCTIFKYGARDSQDVGQRNCADRWLSRSTITTVLLSAVSAATLGSFTLNPPCSR